MLLNIMNVPAKSFSQVCVYILLKERELHSKQTANSCLSAPNLECWDGLWLQAQAPALPICSPGLHIRKSSQHIPKPTEQESVGSYLKYSSRCIPLPQDQSNSTVWSFRFKNGVTAGKSYLPYAMVVLSITLINQYITTIVSVLLN